MSKQASQFWQIGDGATIRNGTDRFAATVIKILPSGRLRIQEDFARRTDDNGMSESQTYDHYPHSYGEIYVLYQNKDRCWKVLGKPYLGVRLGHRSTYIDYSR